MENNKLIVLGIGRNTPVFMDLALDCGLDIKELYHYNDDRTGDNVHGYPIVGSFDDLFSQDISGKNFLLTMGDLSIRKQLTERITNLGGNIPNLISPLAKIARWSKIGDSGVLIFNFSFIQTETEIKSNTVILAQSNIAHNCKVDEFCFISTKVGIGAYTHVGKGVFIGQGALSISEKVKTIGEGAYIGARALLTKDVPSNAVMAGIPARILKQNRIHVGDC